MLALRGQVWDVDFVDFGQHPAVVMTTNAPNAALGHVAVIVITGSAGPDATHIPLGGDAGLTRYDVSYADVTSLQPVDRHALVQQRGLLSSGELRRVEDVLRIYLGL